MIKTGMPIKDRLNISDFLKISRVKKYYQQKKSLFESNLFYLIHFFLKLILLIKYLKFRFCKGFVIKVKSTHYMQDPFTRKYIPDLKVAI